MVDTRTGESIRALQGPAAHTAVVMNLEQLLLISDYISLQGFYISSLPGIESFGHAVEIVLDHLLIFAVRGHFDSLLGS